MPDLIVRKNRHGDGVYAGRLLKKGEKIFVLNGKRRTLKDLYANPKRAAEEIDYPLQIGKKLYLELDNPSVYFNHSCSPNSGVRNRSGLFALRDIKPGEEITYDYSTTIDESFKCQCGSKKCRRVLVDFFGLPRLLQKRYVAQGAVPKFILKKYRR